MNRSATHMMSHARPHALGSGVLGTRRRAERGIALLMAVALVTFITAATLISLRAVATESAIQGQERRAREAFFAAQAGLAEGREVVRQRLNGEPDINLAMSAFAPHITHEPGLPSSDAFPWYQVLGWTPYTLSSTGPELAVDPSIAVANREMYGPDGLRIDDFPEASNVRYRVFLVDDEDETTSRLAGDDSNNRVWLVSVGEVTDPRGGQPHRSIVRMLITPGAGGGVGQPCHEALCEANEG
ncbi:hypothetical protein ACLESO_23070 [Pyxidicoccus sp. 3LG]